MVKYLDKNSGFNMWNASRSAAMEKEKKSPFSGMLWWVLIFVASWWLVGTWMNPKKTDVPADVAPAPVEDLSAVPTVSVGSDNIAATVRGLRVNDIKLTDYSEIDSTPVSLLGADGDFAEIGFVATGTAAPTPGTVWKVKDGVYSWRNADGIDFRRTVSGDGYVITVSDEIKNNSSRPASFAPYARVVRGVENRSSAGVYTGAVAYANNDLEHRDWRKLDKKAYAYTTTGGYIGFTDQYWETVAAIDAPDQTMRIKKSGDKYQADVSAGAFSVAPNETKTVRTHIYAGPRDTRALQGAAAQIAHLDKTVDYGWFWFLARPMLWLLNTLNSIVMNYGVAIIIMTLLLRLAIWPLTRKSYTSMMAMQKMQPEMSRIQKQYANDKVRMQMEMMRLYRTHKTSPMSGCLPMLIQIPIFFALYKALLISVPMRGAHFLWIRDLAAMDPYFILPALMGLTMFWQQRIQTAAPINGNDAMAQTQRFMKWMPLLFTIMFAWMPAGLVLYWTVSNLLGIGQMYIIRLRDKK